MALSTNEGPRRFCGCFCWLLPTILGAVLYGVNLAGTFIYDDLWFAKEDPRLGDAHRWGEFWTQPYMDGGADHLWRPLVSMSFALQHWMHPVQAWPFHAVNLLLHAAVCGMVATLGRRLTGRTGMGLAAGLLFAAHPIHVEAVAGLVGRAEEMCTIGILGALLLMVGRPMALRRAWAITGCFLFAALSKEQGILLPFLLWWGWKALSHRTEAPSGDIPGATGREGIVHAADSKDAGRWLAVLLTGTLAVYISYRNHVAPWYWDTAFLDWQMNPIVRSAGIDRWLIPVAILGRYTALLLFPWRLAPDYSAMVFSPVQPMGDPYLWVGFATAALATEASMFAVIRRQRVWVFCMGGLALTYFLASNLLVIGTIFGERLMYLPSVFVCLMAGMAMDRLKPTTGGWAMAIILTAYVARTESYAWHWNDRASFYAYAARVQPKSGQIYLLWGDELEKRRGDLDGAEKAYAMGRTACPGYWRLLDASARLALQRGRVDEAAAWGRESLRSQAHPGGATAELLNEIEAKRARR